MKYGAKMALMTTMARMDEPSAGTHMPPYANDNGGMRNGYAEGAFRDNRGRRHYDNGRFAPKSEMDGRTESKGRSIIRTENPGASENCAKSEGGFKTIWRLIKELYTSAWTIRSSPEE